MKLGVASVVVLFAALTQVALASPARAPSPAAAAAAFERLLHHRYAGAHGYAACPAAQTARGRIDCLAEVHSGSHWHQVSASARFRTGQVVLTNVSARSWVRHWWPYSRRWLADNEPGKASVNSDAYDWTFLASGAAQLEPGARAKVDAYDGDGKGWSRFFLFSCSRQSDLITCRNGLGDAMRYRLPRK